MGRYSARPTEYEPAHVRSFHARRQGNRRHHQTAGKPLAGRDSQSRRARVEFLAGERLCRHFSDRPVWFQGGRPGSVAERSKRLHLDGVAEPARDHGRQRQGRRHRHHEGIRHDERREALQDLAPFYQYLGETKREVALYRQSGQGSLVTKSAPHQAAVIMSTRKRDLLEWLAPEKREFSHA